MVLSLQLVSRSYPVAERGLQSLLLSATLCRSYFVSQPVRAPPFCYRPPRLREVRTLAEGHTARELPGPREQGRRSATDRSPRDALLPALPPPYPGPGPLPAEPRPGRAPVPAPKALPTPPPPRTPAAPANGWGPINANVPTLRGNPSER